MSSLRLRPQVGELTGDSSQVDGLFGAARAALFRADVVLAGRVHAELQDVVLLHHCGHTDVTSSRQRYQGDGQRAKQQNIDLNSPVMMCQRPLHSGSSGVKEVEKSPLPLFTNTVT